MMRLLLPSQLFLHCGQLALRHREHADALIQIGLGFLQRRGMSGVAVAQLPAVLHQLFFDSNCGRLQPRLGRSRVQSLFLQCGRVSGGLLGQCRLKLVALGGACGQLLLETAGPLLRLHRALLSGAQLRQAVGQLAFELIRALQLIRAVGTQTGGRFVEPS